MTFHDRVEKELLEINNRIQATDKNNVTELDKLKQEQSKLLVFIRKEEYDKEFKNYEALKATVTDGSISKDRTKPVIQKAVLNSAESALREALDELKQQQQSQTSQNVANEVLQLQNS